MSFSINVAFLAWCIVPVFLVVGLCFNVQFCFCQILLGDREGAINLLWHEFICSRSSGNVWWQCFYVWRHHIFKMQNMRWPDSKIHRSCVIEINCFKHTQFGLIQLMFLNRTLFQSSVFNWNAVTSGNSPFTSYNLAT